MSDYDYNDYNDYNDEYNAEANYDNYEINDDYNYDNYGNDDNQEWENQLDNLLLEAKTDNDKEKFKQIMDLENDNLNKKDFTFQSYQCLCIINIKEKNIQEFKYNFYELVKLYPEVDASIKSETIREILYNLSGITDNLFTSNTCEVIIDTLHDKIGDDMSIDREILNTGVLFGRNLINSNKMEELGKLLEDMFYIMEKIDMSKDDVLSSSKLELIILKIQYCTYNNLTKEAKSLYYEAEKLNNKKFINDNSISSVINEQGAKLSMINKNYDKALELFKQSYYNYQNSGNNHKAQEMLKYSVLNSIIVRNSSTVIGEDEIKMYSENKKLMAIYSLKKAYDNADITLINEIWNTQIIKQENDVFIINQLNEILHGIRLNFIRIKLSAFYNCKFTTLYNELGIDKDYLISILFEIILNDNNKNISIDFINEMVVVKEKNLDYDNYCQNVLNWIDCLNVYSN